MTSAHFILTLCILAAGSGLWITIAGRPLRGLCLAIFASAVLLAPRLPVVRDKVGLCEVVMLLTWAAMLYRRPPGVPLFAEQKTAIWRGALLIGACLCSFGVNAAAGDLSLERSGVETANYVYGFLLFVTTIRLVDSWEKWVACFFAWFWGTALVSAVAVATLAGRGPAWARDEFTGRISSTLKFSNQLPGYCLPVFTLAVLLMAMRDTPKRTRWALLALAIGSGLAVIGSGSRTGLLMLCLCVVMVIWLSLRETSSSVLSQGSLTAMGAALAAAIVVGMVRTGSGAGSYALGKTPAYERSMKMSVEWLEGKRTLDDTRHRAVVGADELVFRPTRNRRRPCQLHPDTPHPRDSQHLRRRLCRRGIVGLNRDVRLACRRAPLRFGRSALPHGR